MHLLGPVQGLQLQCELKPNGNNRAFGRTPLHTPSSSISVMQMFVKSSDEVHLHKESVLAIFW